MLKKVKLDEAVGLTLGHDVTKVVPGQFKGPAFHRGHTITEEDTPELLSIGKEHVYIIEGEEGQVHEEKAALRIARAISSANMELSRPSEGRVNIRARASGLLRVNVPMLREINSMGEIAVATLHTNTVCPSGAVVAAAKIIPLYIAEGKLDELEELCREEGKVLQIVPLAAKRVGVVITGNEVFKGRIQDRFGETIRKKAEALGSAVHYQTMVPDDADMISHAIIEMNDRGSDVIFVCGGLSVDPDDVTVEGVKRSGAEIVSYGAPVMPGSMFLYATLHGTPILGAPACVIFNKATAIDVLLPRVLAGDAITREDIAELGHGGLCLGCTECAFPTCPFCK